MTIGDRVRLHVSPGRRATLGLPEGIGIVRSVDQDHDHTGVLVCFGDMAVYLWPVSEGEVEVLTRSPN